MAKVPVVIVSRAGAGRVAPHARIIEDAGGALQTAELDDARERESALRNATVAIVSMNRMQEPDFAAAASLKAVLTMSVGVDSIDLEAATRHGVMVGNVPDLCTEEVADHALLLLLACYRRLPQAMAQIRTGQAPDRAAIFKQGRPWPRLRGQTVGLLGFGNIARAFATRCQACGLNVITHDPYVDSRTAEPTNVELVSFEQILARADFLSVHTALSPTTRHLVDAAALAQMKSTAFLLNTARGPIVDEAALVQALRAGTIAGAGLDVFEAEPPSLDNPLYDMPNVIATPHTAGYSDDAIAWAPLSAAQDAATVLRGGRVRSIQNPDVLETIAAGTPS